MYYLCFKVFGLDFGLEIWIRGKILGLCWTRYQNSSIILWRIILVKATIKYILTKI